MWRTWVSRHDVHDCVQDLTEHTICRQNIDVESRLSAVHLYARLQSADKACYQFRLQPFRHTKGVNSSLKQLKTAV